MLRKLKQSRFGKLLYRMSCLRAGRPLRWVANWVESGAELTVHLKPENLRHNRDRSRTLTAFEQKTGTDN
jgi:hypothetical protein